MVVKMRNYFFVIICNLMSLLSAVTLQRITSHLPRRQKMSSLLSFGCFSTVVVMFCRSRRANAGLHPTIASMLLMSNFFTSAVVQGNERTKIVHLNKLTFLRLNQSVGNVFLLIKKFITVYNRLGQIQHIY